MGEIAADKEQVWAYIARTTKPLKHHPDIGSVVCTTVDRPEFAESNAKEIAKWMRDGLTTERVPVEWVRKFFGTTTPYSSSFARDIAL